MKQRDWRIADVAQFDEFICRVVENFRSRTDVGRMIHDFTDDQRSHFWAGIYDAQSGAGLNRKLLVPGADDIAAKSRAVLLRAKIKAMRIAGKIPVGIRGEQIHCISQRAERERNASQVIEIQFRVVKQSESARSNERVAWDAVFGWYAPIIRQKPAADVGRSRAEVLQFDGILRRRSIAAAEHLVHHHPR